MRKFLIGSVLILGVGAAWAWQSGAVEKFTDSSAGAIPACEAVLAKILKSPSTYSRIKADFFPAPSLTFEEYRKFELTQGCTASPFGSENCIRANAYMRQQYNDIDLEQNGQAKLQGKKRKAAIEAIWQKDYERYQEVWGKNGAAYVILEFDAKNEFGSPLRDKFMCNFGRKMSGKFSEGDIYLPDENISGFEGI